MIKLEYVGISWNKHIRPTQGKCIHQPNLQSLWPFGTLCLSGSSSQAESKESKALTVGGVIACRTLHCRVSELFIHWVCATLRFAKRLRHA